MTSLRLTMAQALVKALAAQWVEHEGRQQRLFAGVWAIFGHGNVAAMGEALKESADVLPTLRAHNEQAMAHAAIAFAKASRRRRAIRKRLGRKNHVDERRRRRVIEIVLMAGSVALLGALTAIFHSVLTR